MLAFARYLAIPRPRRVVRSGLWSTACASILLLAVDATRADAQQAPRSRVEAIAALRRARTAAQLDDAAGAARLVAEAAAFARQADDRLVAAWTHQLAGELAFGKGDLTAARSAFTAGLEAFEALEDAAGVAACRVNRGRLSAADGQTQEAVADLEAALAAYVKLGQTAQRVATLADLAAAQQGQGAYDAAEASLRAALELDRAATDRLPRTEPELLAALGACLVRQVKYAAAVAPLKEGAEAAKKLAAADVEGEARAALAVAYHRTGELEAALSEYRAALILVGSRDGKHDGLLREADLRNNLGALEQQQGRPQAAAVELTKALDLYAQAKNDVGTARACCNLALVREAQGKNAEAIAAYEQGLTLRRKQNDPAGCAAILDGLAQLYASQNEPAKAREYQAEADRLRNSK